MLLEIGNPWKQQDIVSNLYRLQSEGIECCLFMTIHCYSLALETSLEGKRKLYDMLIENGIVDGLKQIFHTSKDNKTLV